MDIELQLAFVKYSLTFTQLHVDSSLKKAHLIF